MGKHSEWRKLVKKLRRKRLRQKLASEREEKETQENERRLQSPSYRASLEEQEKADLYQEEEEARISKRNEEEWIRREEEAQSQWQELQKKLELAREERAKQNARIKQEWETEQKRLKELIQLKKRKEEEKVKQQELLQERIEEYIAHGGELPEQLLVPLETNPNKEICMFFKKTGACRFGDSCSRNHVRPGVSKIILIPNFYSHYGLFKTEDNEYGNDSSLEFEHHEMRSHFKEFFYDVLPEVEKLGHVRQFKVCCNHEPHLRGNVYIEYSDYREAMKSYRVLQGRWYGGKQMNVEFSNIESWKSAICGLFSKRRCPKGSSCNFLHVFQNPCNLFQNADKDLHRTPVQNDFENGIHEGERNWRWSESPEPMDYHRENGKKHSSQKNSSERSHRSRENGYDRHSSRKRRYRSRSKSPTRKRRRSRSKTSWQHSSRRSKSISRKSSHRSSSSE